MYIKDVCFLLRFDIRAVVSAGMHIHVLRVFL